MPSPKFMAFISAALFGAWNLVLISIEQEESKSSKTVKHTEYTDWLVTEVAEDEFGSL